MFDKVKQGKQLLQMRKQAMELKKELEKLEHSEEKGDCKVKVNGASEMVHMVVDGEERPDLVKLINEANKKMQKESARKMMESGGGLSGLLGGMG